MHTCQIPPFLQHDRYVTVLKSQDNIQRQAKRDAVQDGNSVIKLLLHSSNNLSLTAIIEACPESVILCDAGSSPFCNNVSLALSHKDYVSP